MAKKQVTTSRYDVISKSQAIQKLENKYEGRSVKSNKTVIFYAVLAGLATLYAVEAVLLALFSAASGFFSGMSLTHLTNTLSDGAATSSVTQSVANSNSFFDQVIDVLLFFIGFKSVGIGFVAWTIAIIVGIYIYFKMHSNSTVINDLTKVENLLLDPNDSFMSYIPDLIKGGDMNIAMDAKAVVDCEVSAIMAHFLIKPNGITGKDGNVKIDTKTQEDWHKIWRLKAGQLSADGTPANTIFDAKDLIFDELNSSGEYPKAGVKTVAELINKNIFVMEPDIESTQPIVGFYLVSTQPSNTYVVAATRAGKGQKYIEPEIDIWSRQKHQPNILATDPKGELLRKNARQLSLRGYEVKAINTLRPELSSSYNIYSYALQAADRGDFDAMSSMLQNVSDVMFAADGDNAYWYQSAAKLVNLCALAIVDFALEDARRVRNDYSYSYDARNVMVDNIFGSVSAVNVVHFLNQLYATTISFKDNEELMNLVGYTEDKSALFVFLELIGKLPETPIRRKLQGDFAFLKAQMGNEKGMASVLSIALQIMAFFGEEAITKVTSGNPSKTFDFMGLGFPRRFGVWIDDYYLTLNVLALAKTHWQAYKDPEMTQPFGSWKTNDNGEEYFDTSKFESVGNFKKGWTWAMIEGIFDQPKVYLKLELINNGDLIDLFTFEFEKGFVKDLTGNTYDRDKATYKFNYQDGNLREYDFNDSNELVYTHKTFKSLETSLSEDFEGVEKIQRPLIKQTIAKYTERPVALFLVTPPQQVTYNRLAIMVLDAAFNEQFSYAVENSDTPKPFIATKYMLDEFGNISSNGKGIPSMDTKLSIGLGLKQQFTIILQSFTQMDALYSSQNRDIMLGNLSQSIFLKSTSKDVIEKVMELGGTHKKIVTDSLSKELYLGDMKSLEGMKSSGRVQAGIRSTDEAAIPENVFRALGEDVAFGEAVTYSGTTQSLVEGAYALPMAFKLLKTRPGGANDKINNNDLPISAPNAEFDISRNVPNYMEKLQNLSKWVMSSSKLQERWQERNDIKNVSEIAHVIAPEEYNRIIMNAVFDGLNPQSKVKDASTLSDTAIEYLHTSDWTITEENSNFAVSDSDLNEDTLNSIKANNALLIQMERGLLKTIKINDPSADIKELEAKVINSKNIDPAFNVLDMDIAKGSYLDSDSVSILNTANMDASFSSKKQYGDNQISRMDLDSLGAALIISGIDAGNIVSEAIVIGARKSWKDLSKYSFTTDYDELDDFATDLDFELKDGNGQTMIKGSKVMPEFIEFLCGFMGANPDKFPNMKLSKDRDLNWIDRDLNEFDKAVGAAYKEIIERVDMDA